MKKIINICLVLLVIAAVVIGCVIAIEYFKRAKNEEVMAGITLKVEDLIKDKKEEKQIDNEQENKKVVTIDGYPVEGIIEIPTINIKYPIVADTSDAAMEVAIIKYWGKEINGVGNYSIAGHNYKNGTMFGKTKYLKNGDKIYLTDLNDNRIEYEVYKVFNVDPNDVTILENSNEEIREVTLITCTKGHKERLIIKAKEVI